MNLSMNKLDYYIHVINQLEINLNKMGSPYVSKREKELCKLEVERYRHILDTMDNDWLFE